MPLDQIPLDKLKLNLKSLIITSICRIQHFEAGFRKAIIICRIKHFEADFLWKVGLKILNLGIIVKSFTHADDKSSHWPEKSRLYVFFKDNILNDV